MLIESHVNKLEEDILAFQEGEYFCRLASEEEIDKQGWARRWLVALINNAY